jgi:2-dehydro-3-deoxyglucarate aldolase/4-hydroxy-2-oxoheptanedioate aldolase
MPHDDYGGGDVVQKLSEANERTLVIALIETATGIANTEAIMAVDGIDIGWLGHFNLTNSMGIPAQFEHPDFLAAVDKLVAACRLHGKPAGVLTGSIETAVAWRARGFRVFAYGTDISLLQQSCGRNWHGCEPEENIGGTPRRLSLRDLEVSRPSHARVFWAGDKRMFSRA